MPGLKSYMKFPADNRVLALLAGLALFWYAAVVFAGGGGSDGQIDWAKMAMQLFGGLALFLFGMEQMADALKAVAGERMKGILAKLTTNRFMGAITGAFVTAGPTSAPPLLPRSWPSRSPRPPC